MAPPAHSNKLRRAIYEQLTAECKSLEDEINELKAEIQKKQDALAAKKAERAPFAAVYTLPDEVWLLIIEEAFLHHFPRCHNALSTLTDSPIAFSHVSRRFRQFALALPSIWACVHVHPRQSLDYRYMLRKQLRRSKDRPLSITFICRGPMDETPPMLEYDRHPTFEYDSHLAACWDLLVPHAKRWRHLSFWAEHHLIISDLLGPSKPPFERAGWSLPQLEHLSVCVEKEPMTAETMGIQLRLFFQDTPKLSVLRLHGVLLPPNNKFITLNNITKLSLARMLVESSRLKRMLNSMAGSLSVLVLNNVRLSTDINADSTHVALPRLKHLVLSDVNPLDPCIGFFSFAAPNLSLLEIQAPEPEDEDDAVFPAYPRSSVVFPKVKTLHLFAYWTDNTIHLFEPTFLEFFPALEHIILHEHGAATFSLSSLRALLRSLEESHEEGKPSVPLKKLWIPFSGFGSKESAIEDVFTRIIKHQADLSSPLDEACMMLDRDPREKYGGEEDQGPGILLDESPYWKIVDDYWLVSARDRLWEWDTELDCPTLPYWEPGVEVSWTLGDGDVPLRSSDIV